jgi:hypothetical protein
LDFRRKLELAKRRKSSTDCLEGPETWLTLMPPIPLGTTATPLVRMRGSQAPRTAHLAVVQFGCGLTGGLCFPPRLGSHMEPRPAVILDDLFGRTTKRSTDGYSMQAAAQRFISENKAIDCVCIWRERVRTDTTCANTHGCRIKGGCTRCYLRCLETFLREGGAQVDASAMAALNSCSLVAAAAFFRTRSGMRWLLAHAPA